MDRQESYFLAEMVFDVISFNEARAVFESARDFQVMVSSAAEHIKSDKLTCHE